MGGQRTLGHYGNLRADERRQSASAEFNEFKGEQDMNQSKIRFSYFAVFVGLYLYLCQVL